MEPRRVRSPEREMRSNLIVAGAIGALLVVVIVVVACTSLTARSVVQPAADTAQSSAPSPRAPSAGPSALSGSTSTSTAPDTTTVATSGTPTTTITRATPVPVSKAAQTYPDKMKYTLRGSTQLIVITGARLGSNTGTLRLYNKDPDGWHEVLSTPANFGQTGLVDGQLRQSGHLNTPTGIWKIDDFVFGQGSQAPPGTKMPYRAITANSYWSGEHDSTYNTWVNHKVSGEHLQDAQVQYKYAFNTGYNSPQNDQVIGRGTAIFIHCFEPPGNALGKFTHGCIAIAPSEMMKVFSLLDPARRPSCAIGTEATGTKTSIYSY